MDRLLERGRELRALDGVLARASKGSGGVVVVDGAAGIGKSRLLDSAADLARSRGFGVVRARASELDRDSSFVIATDLFAARVAAAGAEERARLLAGPARLVETVLDGTAPVPVPVDPHAVVRASYWLCVNLAASAPLLLVVDDAQWADRLSIAFLAYLADRAGDLPAVLVVAVGAGDPSGEDDLLTRLRAAAGVTRLQPDPLSDAAVGEVVAGALPGADAAFVAACARVTGGNPFLATELARALRDDGVEPSAASVERVAALVPDSVLAAVLGRIVRLGDAAGRVARSVAVLGDGATVRLVADVTDLDPRTVEEAADALARAHVLEPGGPLRFTHALIASAVYAEIPAFARARAHGRAAAVLGTDGAAVDVLARHLVQTRPDGDGATARTLRAAARRASVRGDPAAAVHLLQRAVVEPPPAAERAGVLLDLAEAQLAQGDVGALDSADEALSRAASPDDRLRVLRIRARCLFNRGDHVAAAAAYDHALSDVDPCSPAGEQLLAEYLTAHTFDLRLRADTHARIARLGEAARHGDLPGNPGLLAHLTLHEAFAGAPGAHVRMLAERATAESPLVDPATQGFFMGIVVQALVAVDELATAERIATRAMRATQENGSLLAYTLANYHRAIARHHCGALRDALDDLDQALLATREGWSGGTWVFAQQARTQLERGEVAHARASLATAGPASPFEMGHGLASYAEACVALAEHDAARALEAARTAGCHLADGFGIDHPGFVPWRDVAALAAHGLDRHDEATALADDALARARWSGVARAVSRSLRTCATVGEPSERVERLREAIALLDDRPVRLERAYALVDLGVALRHAGQRDDARAVLRDGLQLADTMGAAPLVARATAELHATGARPRRAAHTGADSLTPAERRVAELAASGLTNSKIAQELFVTPKTVETHLAHAFRKLGIDSRRDLAGALRGARHA